MPRNPKLMFQICQKLFRGFCIALRNPVRSGAMLAPNHPTLYSDCHRTSKTLNQVVLSNELAGKPDSFRLLPSPVDSYHEAGHAEFQTDLCFLYRCTRALTFRRRPAFDNED